MSDIKVIPGWLYVLRENQYGRIALKLIRNWQKSKFQTVTVDTIVIEGEEISYISLGKCYCVECEAYLSSISEPSTIKMLAEAISSELEKRGQIKVFFEDNNLKTIRPKIR